MVVSDEVKRLVLDYGVRQNLFFRLLNERRLVYLRLVEALIRLLYLSRVRAVDENILNKGLLRDLRIIDNLPENLHVKLVLCLL